MTLSPEVLVVVVVDVSEVVVSSVVVVVVVVVAAAAVVAVVVVVVGAVIAVVGVEKGVSGRVEWFAVCTTATTIAMITRTPSTPAAVTAPGV